MSDIETPNPELMNAWQAIQAAETPDQKRQLARWAIKGMDMLGFDLPVPPMFFDFDWAGEGDEAVDDILTQLVMAEDLAVATSGRELRKVGALVGQPIELLGALARKGTIEDAKWGAYLTLTVSVNGAEPEVVHTSSPQIVTTVWLLQARGELPAVGRFIEVAIAKKGQSAPLGFQLLREFPNE